MKLLQSVTKDDIIPIIDLLLQAHYRQRDLIRAAMRVTAGQSQSRTGFDATDNGVGSYPCKALSFGYGAQFVNMLGMLCKDAGRGTVFPNTQHLVHVHLMKSHGPNVPYKIRERPPDEYGQPQEP